ncbi:hypothetical protein LO749_20780 [Paracoccus denitrificans]|uniref:hypothetical protein n=1 Tax=Paracoccus denitrificans TaxID=266 RepID=UPI001E3AFC1E|nr:hypothetical protein [Paracoccus denitrificans]UFS66932.1 hypothetical protein LO749_20780 [Paracoccus denitrificans]
MDRREYIADETRNGVEYRAILTVMGGIGYEAVVDRNTGAIPHMAEFPASNLGLADRAEYTRVMLASVLNQMEREARK